MQRKLTEATRCSRFSMTTFHTKMKAAISIYPFAKLRHLAKEKVLKNPEKILELPITARHAVEMVEENAEELAKQMGDESPDMLKSAMTMIHQRYEEMKEQQGWAQGVVDYFVPKPEQSTPGTTLVAFGDNNAENELVYGVTVDRYVQNSGIVFQRLRFC